MNHIYTVTFYPGAKAPYEATTIQIEGVENTVNFLKTLYLEETPFDVRNRLYSICAQFRVTLRNNEKRHDVYMQMWNGGSMENGVSDTNKNFFSLFSPVFLKLLAESPVKKYVEFW